MAHSVGRPALDFPSGHDLKVVESRPEWAFHSQCGVCFSLSLSRFLYQALPPTCAFSPSLSLKWINNYLKKENNIFKCVVELWQKSNKVNLKNAPQCASLWSCFNYNFYNMQIIMLYVPTKLNRICLDGILKYETYEFNVCHAICHENYLIYNLLLLFFCHNCHFIL